MFSGAGDSRMFPRISLELGLGYTIELLEGGYYRWLVSLLVYL